jgi:hypothetical protein
MAFFRMFFGEQSPMIVQKISLFSRQHSPKVSAQHQMPALFLRYIKEMIFYLLRDLACFCFRPGKQQNGGSRIRPNIFKKNKKYKENINKK